MSHYHVLVIHRKDQDIEDLLAPYDEGLQVEPHREFTRQEAISFARERFDRLKDATDEECYQFIAEDYPDDLRDSEGNLYSRYNSNARWDWYCVGGRFAGRLKAKAGKHGDGSAFHENPREDGWYDEARLGDVDFSADPGVRDASMRYWEVVVEGKPLREDEDPDRFFSLYKPEYYLEKYQDKETYGEACSRFSPYACVTPDGEWHSGGTMWYFGYSDEDPAVARDWELNFVDRFIKGADPDLIITSVDCHI